MIIFRMPGAYLVEEVDQKLKDTVVHYRKCLDEISNGVREYIILPSDVDEMGNRLFDIEIINNGSSAVQFKPSGGK